MSRVCHLIDSQSGFSQRVSLLPLFERAEADAICVACRGALDPHLQAGIQGHHLHRLPGGLPGAAVPGLMALRRQQPFDLVHAWGLQAALAARTAFPSLPIVLSWFDPHVTPTQSRWLRVLAGDRATAISCGSQTTLRRLVERGVPPERCVLIRGGVDFRQLNEWRRKSARTTLGLAPNENVLLISPPITAEAGAFDACWVSVLHAWLAGRARVLLPAETREAGRIARYGRRLADPDIVVPVPEAVPLEDLIAIADVIVLATPRDVDSTPLAWAMAARTAIVATAVHSVAELIGHKLNGLLFHPRPGRRLNTVLADLLADGESQRKGVEAAYGQAYEVFSIRRYVEQTAKLHANMLSGAALDEGITDPALVTGN